MPIPPEPQQYGTIFQKVLPIVAAAFLLRLFFVCLNFHSLASSDHFEAFGAEMGWTARSLAQGRGYSSPFDPITGPSALVPPLFPLLLAGIFRIFGVYTNASAFAALTLNSLFSSLTAAVIFLGTRSRLGNNTATSAAWLWALYPYSIYFSAVYLWDFALTSLLFASCFFLATTRLPQMRLPGWASFGILAGLATLSNPSVLPMLAVLTGYATWKRWRLGGRIARRLLTACAFMAMAISPWLVRNIRVFHEPLLRDGFWGEFYAGNNGDTSQSNSEWTHPASNAREMARYRALGETGYMAEKRALSLQHIHAFPGQFAAVSIRRFIRYWTGYWSFSRHYLADQPSDLPNVPFCSLLTALMLVGLGQTWLRSRFAASPYAAAFLLFPLPYYITHSSIDYRQPLEPLIAVTATCGAKWLLERWSASRQASSVFALSDLA